MRSALENLAVTGLMDRLNTGILASLNQFAHSMIKAARTDDLRGLIDVDVEFNWNVWDLMRL